MPVFTKGEDEALRPQLIDLDGPEGNAWNLMGYARRAAQLRGWSKEEFEELRGRMMSKNYVNLIYEMDQALPGAFQFITDRDRGLYQALIDEGVAKCMPE